MAQVQISLKAVLNAIRNEGKTLKEYATENNLPFSTLKRVLKAAGYTNLRPPKVGLVLNVDVDTPVATEAQVETAAINGAGSQEVVTEEAAVADMQSTDTEETF